MSNIIEDKIFNLLKEIGFVSLESKYKIRAEVNMRYNNYTFYKYFTINVPHPLYALKLYTNFLFDCKESKEEVYVMLNELFKKEIRVNKINKLLNEELHN
jgi:hypothetical protein